MSLSFGHHSLIDNQQNPDTTDTNRDIPVRALKTSLLSDTAGR